MWQGEPERREVWSATDRVSRRTRSAAPRHLPSRAPERRRAASQPSDRACRRERSVRPAAAERAAVRPRRTAATRPSAACCCSSAAVIALIWANWPWGDAYDELDRRPSSARRPCIWICRCRYGRPTACWRSSSSWPGSSCSHEFELGTPGRAAQGGCTRSRQRSAAWPCRPILYVVVNLLSHRRAGRRLGHPHGHRHRVRAGGPGRRGPQPAGGAARVPAVPGGGRRPRRHPGHRRVLLQRLLLRCHSPSPWLCWRCTGSCSGGGSTAG